MSENSIDAVRIILQSRDLSQFLGMKEDLWFEAKHGKEYDFDNPKHKYELAKDISAFANSEGGYLVIGLKTKPVQEQRTDEVCELDLIAKEDFDITVYKQIIKKHISKNIDVEILWVEDNSQTGKGVGYIYVPTQIEEEKYFLVSGIVEGNERLSGILFAIVRRAGSNNIPFEKEHVHRLMQNGKSEASQRLGRIEELIIALIEKSERAKGLSNEEDRLIARMNEIAEE